MGHYLKPAAGHLLSLSFPLCKVRELGQGTLRLKFLHCSAGCLNEMSSEDKSF